MLPAVPRERINADSVANLKGPNQRVKSLKDPIRLQAIPIPSINRPRTSISSELAHAKMSAPMTATRDKTVMVFLGPIRSRYIPMGIWVKAKA